jgi:hypothetical protein
MNYLECDLAVLKDILALRILTRDLIENRLIVRAGSDIEKFAEEIMNLPGMHKGILIYKLIMEGGSNNKNG